MKVKKPSITLKSRLQSLFSWISFGQEHEETAFHPETVIFETIKNRSVSWSKKQNVVSFVAIVLFFTVCATLYALTIKGLPGNPNPAEIKRLDKNAKPFELSPERGRYAHTYALAENGSFSLSRDLADAVYPDVGYVDGRFYSFFAPGISIIAVPFYKIGSIFHLAQIASYSVIALFAMGNLFFLYRIGRDVFKLPTANALLSPVLFGFGSTSWSYATTMYQHHLTTFFIISSFYAVWRFSQKSSLSILWGCYIWFCYAAAFMVDYPNLLFMAPVMLYFFFTALSWSKIKRNLTLSLRPAFILTSVCFFALSLFHAYYNYTQFGDWKKLSGNIVGYKLIREKQLLERQGGAAAIKKLANTKPSSSFFSEENFSRGVVELSVAPDKGLFFFSPIFLLALLAIGSSLKRVNRERGILLSIVTVNLFLYSSFGDPWGGWAYGPRYLILSMAILSLFISLWLSQLKHLFIGKTAVFVLFAVSSAISLLGVLTTNAIPPKVEADFIKSSYGFFLAYEFFNKGISSSFAFHEFFARLMTLPQYFTMLYMIVLLLILIILVFVKKSTYEN